MSDLQRRLKLPLLRKERILKTKRNNSDIDDAFEEIVYYIEQLEKTLQIQDKRIRDTINSKQDA